MIPTIPCSCIYCIEKIQLFWFIGILFITNSDIKRIIHLIITTYDDEFLKYYEYNNIKKDPFISKYIYIDGHLKEIHRLSKNLKELHYDYNRDISVIQDNVLYKNMYYTMDSYMVHQKEYNKLFDSCNTKLNDYYNKVKKEKDLFIKIKSNMIQHILWPVLSKKTMDEIGSNIMLLDNANNEIIRSYILQRYKGYRYQLLNLLDKCSIIPFTNNDRGPILFGICNSNRFNILNELKKLCNYCIDMVHDSKYCIKKHCFIVCSKSRTDIKKYCTKCEENDRLNITKECNLTHCSYCYHHHHDAKNCPMNHCYIICSNNGKSKKNCKDCEQREKNCQLTHCKKCNHHHRTEKCKKK